MCSASCLLNILAQKTCQKISVCVTVPFVFHLFILLEFSLITILKWNFVRSSSHVGKKEKRLVLTRTQKTQLTLSQYVYFLCNASVMCHKYLTFLSSSAKLMPRSESCSWVDDSTDVSEQHGASIFCFFTARRTCIWRRHFTLKPWCLSTRLHGVTFHYNLLPPPCIHQITLICLVS